MTQPDKSPLPASTTIEPANAPDQSPVIEDLDAAKGVADADANRVKGGVKKTMSTQ